MWYKNADQFTKAQSDVISLLVFPDQQSKILKYFILQLVSGEVLRSITVM